METDQKNSHYFFINHLLLQQLYCACGPGQSLARTPEVCPEDERRFCQTESARNSSSATSFSEHECRFLFGYCSGDFNLRPPIRNFQLIFQLVLYPPSNGLTLYLSLSHFPTLKLLIFLQVGNLPTALSSTSKTFTKTKKHKKI